MRFNSLWNLSLSFHLNVMSQNLEGLIPHKKPLKKQKNN